MNEFDQAIINLHNIARQLEVVFKGKSKLSVDCRRLADKITEINKPEIETKPTAKGDQ